MSLGLRERECGSKIRFWTKERAVAAAKAYCYQFGTRAVGAYVCRWCGGWHIGHNRINERWNKRKP